MGKILILGGAGFIGFYLTRHLAQNPDNQIQVVDNLSRGESDREFVQFLEGNPQVQFLTADLVRPEVFQQLDGPYDYVYLLAGIIGVRNVEADPARVIHTNTTIILNTLEWLRQVGCGRLLFASTSETYGGSVESGIAKVPTAEDVPLVVEDIQHPRATYALSKMVGEAAITHYAQSYGFQAVIVRYHNVYGPRMGFDHVVPELMQRINEKIDPLPVYGLEQTRAFCYVSDAVEACEALMHCPLNGCQIVHVGNDNEETTIKDLLGKILKVVGASPAITELPAPSGAVSRRCPDIGKLRSMTSFTPQVDLDSGLKLTWEWYRARLEQDRASISRAGR